MNPNLSPHQFVVADAAQKHVVAGLHESARRRHVAEVKRNVSKGQSESRPADFGSGLYQWRPGSGWAGR